jgi:hypothetical protein
MDMQAESRGSFQVPAVYSYIQDGQKKKNEKEKVDHVALEPEPAFHHRQQRSERAKVSGVT